MENLRWIILVIGLAIVLVIYLFGKSRDKDKQIDLPEPLAADEMPSISTSENMIETKIEQAMFESTNPGINHFDLDRELIEKVAASVDEVLPEVMFTGSAVSPSNKINSGSPSENLDEDVLVIEEAIEEPVIEQPETRSEAIEYEDDLIIFHVKAKTAYFNGKELLQVINHQQLKFGDMNIYHAFDDNNKIIFSMSNMIEPGHFEPDTINEMRTPGVILFMQLSLVGEPEGAFQRMNHCAETLARDLDGKLTGSDQQIITDQDIEAFKIKAIHFKNLSQG